MSASLVVLCVAAAAVVGLVSSAVIAGALALGRRRLARTAPAARARLYLAAAVAPVVTTAAALIAALSPSFGWIADHCAPASAPHGHPHLCAAHHVAAWPSLPIAALAAVLLGRVALGWAAAARATIGAARAARALARDAAREGDVLVLPVDAPQAFVLGALSPTLFVTRGLRDGALAPHLDAVLAHERAHLRRRDGLRRLVAAIARPLHLPWVGAALERALGRAHEMAADDEAARAVGSAPRVAEAIVAVARAARRAPAHALPFTGPELERRVVRLLDERADGAAPGVGALALAGAAVVGAILLAAELVHHGLETTLGILGG